MKVIFVNIGMQMFRGGGENFDVNMAAALRRKGLSVELISLKPLFLPVRHSENDTFDRVILLRSPWLYPITQLLHTCRFSRYLRVVRGVPRILGQIAFELRVFFYLRRVANNQVLIHLCALPLLSFLCFKVLGIKAVLRMPGPVLNKYDSFFGTRSQYLIANGDAYKQILERFNPPNLHFINIGVFKFRTEPLKGLRKFREMLGVGKKAKLFLFVGRLIEIKDIPFLLRSFHAYLLNNQLDATLIVAGAGPLLPDLERLAVNLGLEKRVIFVGPITKECLAKYYQAADLVLLTSKYDNFPNVLVEALSCGTPCVAMDVGGVSQIVNHGENGILVKDRDPVVFSKAIKMALLTDLEHGPALARKTHRLFDFDDSATALVKLCQI